MPDLDGFNTMANLLFHFNANQVKPSNQVGLHPQLLAYNVVNSDGKNVGFNPNQTIGPGGIARYTLVRRRRCCQWQPAYSDTD